MELRPEDRDSLNQERELSNGQDIVIVNTALIMKAMQGMQKAQADFQELLERAELGDASVQYELGVRYATGDGVSSNTVYFRMTQEQFDRFLALTAPYADA